MDNYERQMLEEAIDLLSRIVGRMDAKAAARPRLQLVEGNLEGKVIAFPGPAVKENAPDLEESMAETKAKTVTTVLKFTE